MKLLDDRKTYVDPAEVAAVWISNDKSEFHVSATLKSGAAVVGGPVTETVAKSRVKGLVGGADEG